MLSPSSLRLRLFTGAAWLCLVSSSLAQLVGLPAPRLLTVTPMGGRAGTEVEVSITGENMEEVSALLFSTPGITALPKTNAEGKTEPSKFVVKIAADAPAGVHDARVLTRLGLSSARAFSVGPLAEVTRTKANNSPATALELPLDTVCNAVMTKRAIDFYAFTATKGQRVVVDCAAAGIDSKLTPVLIVADDTGRDLAVNRTDGVVDFTAPADGKYLVKVHGLTFQGGPEHFYRLALRTVTGSGPAPRQPATPTVSSVSWSPGRAALPQVAEQESNHAPRAAQKITPPCEIAGRFFPAADVDTYEFAAKKGETWWIEVASERLGLPTNPFVLVQRVTGEGAQEKLTDVAEIDDIASPMKLSTNGYSYDGPPYDAGSADPLGKVEIKEDGTYRVQIRDLFGGTRTDPSHVYRLIVRKAAPDFALAAWAIHMTLRNGDRAALSKPLALRAGATVALEVVVVRKDGFAGEIELAMEDLPPGLRATGLKIPAGKSKGMMILTAAEDATRSAGVARLVGRAVVEGAPVTRECRLASMKWPVKDASQEIPAPRLLADFPISTTDAEVAPVSIAAREDQVWEARAGERLAIPLKLIWRSEFSGTSIKLKAFGDGFESVKEIDIPLNAATAEAVLDLAALKTPPGEYTLALYGPAVTKYRPNNGARKLAEVVQAAAAGSGPAAAAAEPAKDTVDIVVSEPIRIRIQPAATK